MSPTLANRISTLQISLAMSGVISVVMVAVNHGWSPTFMAEWARSWLIGFCVAYPTASAIVPISRRWVERATAKPPRNN